MRGLSRLNESMMTNRRWLTPLDAPGKLERAAHAQRLLSAAVAYFFRYAENKLKSWSLNPHHEKSSRRRIRGQHIVAGWVLHNCPRYTVGV